MAKKLVDIARMVDNSSLPFIDYLKENLRGEALQIIQEVSKETEVFIFSGVIRNFFLKNTEVRDIDIILNDEIDVEKHFKNFDVKRNSYGGYKFVKNDIVIDLWFLQKTWALQYQPTFNFDIERYIPHTAFFNFSSVIFSFNENKFYATTHFLKFLRDKKIDVVFKPSANYSLCIINSFYYSDRYHLKLANNLKKHILSLSKFVDPDFETPQIKHFGKIIYSSIEILQKISLLK